MKKQLLLIGLLSIATTSYSINWGLASPTNWGSDVRHDTSRIKTDINHDEDRGANAGIHAVTRATAPTISRLKHKINNIVSRLKSEYLKYTGEIKGYVATLKTDITKVKLVLKALKDRHETLTKIKVAKNALDTLSTSIRTKNYNNIAGKLHTAQSKVNIAKGALEYNGELRRNIFVQHFIENAQKFSDLITNLGS